MDIAHVRHSLSHILAMVIIKKFPDTKLGIGPVIEDGFYYDVSLNPQIKLDLKEIEEEMRKRIKENIPFEGKKVTPGEAKNLFKDQQFKLELIDEFATQGKQLTIYKTGDFVDLCKGGHVDNTSQINPDAFTLTSITGAYWRGNEKNPQLTRIYAVAFATKEELTKHLALLEEAKKRDHKKLGKELDLFVFSDLVGPGLPLWTPKGTIVRNILDEAVWNLREKRGYQKVEIPHITKKELYEKSGHWEKFKDELLKIQSREGHEFALKPMNCPHHTQIYSRRAWSYRELPQRYASTTMCYRDEQTGELSGLSRLRSFTQDDSHLFCRQTQVKEEIARAWEIVNEFYKKVGLETRVRMSLHDPHNPKDYLGTPELWQKTESELKTIAEENGVVPEEALGEAAFYGPKIDFIAKDSLGREWQLATIQLDMNLPERFDLFCINEKGQKERIVMLHIAIMGSIERFLSIYIEHCGGAFPFWLAPVQVQVLSISDEQNDYAQTIALQLQEKDLRAEVNSQSETIGKKIREGEMQKIPYLLIVGKKEMADQTIAVRQHGKGDKGTMTVEKFTTHLKANEANS